MAIKQTAFGMENEFMKRGYLLPDGCKDLTNIAKPAQKRPLDLRAPGFSNFKKLPLPPITRQVFVPPKTSIYQLAKLLGLKPFEIAADLLKLGVFGMVDNIIDFKTICEVARMHGFLAIKAGV
jgi:hypothetical protein